MDSHDCEALGTFVFWQLWLAPRPAILWKSWLLCPEAEMARDCLVQNLLFSCHVLLAWCAVHLFLGPANCWHELLALVLPSQVGSNAASALSCKVQSFAFWIQDLLHHFWIHCLAPGEHHSLSENSQQEHTSTPVFLMKRHADREDFKYDRRIWRARRKKSIGKIARKHSDVTKEKKGWETVRSARSCS
jgi:hypothetical protein